MGKKENICTTFAGHDLNIKTGMVFYFTGTGNSLWVARKLAEALHEPLVAVSEAVKNGVYVYPAGKEKRILFVFPVHSWGLPVLAAAFVKKLELMEYAGQPVYVIFTCGDDCGRADKQIKKRLAAKGIGVAAFFSVQMPNNYILLPGFDVDEKSVEEEKLRNAAPALREIMAMIQGAAPLSDRYVSGAFPVLKTGLVYPLFARFSVGKTHFYVTEGCISCGLCVKVCPTGTISWSDSRPVWGNRCVQCLACIHRCPVRAIEYGKITKEKGRYCHPDLRSRKQGDAR